MILHRDGFTSPAMVRAMLEATTATCAPRRKAKQRPSAVPPIIAILAVLAAAYLGTKFL